jgi:hypothetical protein
MSTKVPRDWGKHDHRQLNKTAFEDKLLYPPTFLESFKSSISIGEHLKPH